MNLQVRRDLFSTISTQGELLIDGNHFCYTLEPPYKTDGSKPRAIPEGTYPLTIRWSPEFNKHVPHVENVPGFTAIEQHIGNFPRDTKGCTLVGLLRGPDPNFIGQSLMAFTRLMARYMSMAVLMNPEEKSDGSHIWNVGFITYTRAHDAAPDLDGAISV